METLEPPKEAGKPVRKLLPYTRWEVIVTLTNGVAVRVERSVGSIGLNDKCMAEREAGVKGNKH